MLIKVPSACISCSHHNDYVKVFNKNNPSKLFEPKENVQSAQAAYGD